MTARYLCCTRANGQYFLKDLNSTNGTLLNGQSVDEAQLRENDRVAFADVKGHFSLEPMGVTEPQSKPPVGPPAPSAVPSPAAFTPSSALAGRTPSGVPVSSLPPAPSVPLPGSTALVSKRKRKRSTPPFVIFAGSIALLLILCFAGIKGYQGWQQKNAEHPQAQPRVSNEARPTAPVVAPKPSTEIRSNPKPVVEKAPPAPSESDTRVSQVAAALKNPDVSERRRAAKTLHSLGEESKSAEAELMAALSDSDDEVQIWAALALINNRVYEKKIIPICVNALGQANPVMRQVVCLSLALFPYEESEKAVVVPALQSTAAQDTDADVKKAATSALAIIDPGALPAPTKN